MNRARKASEPRPQVVTVVDLEKLIGKYGDYMSATPFNVGNAMRMAAIRGKSAFVKLQDWREGRWKSEMVRFGKRERGEGCGGHAGLLGAEHWGVRGDEC